MERRARDPSQRNQGDSDVSIIDGIMDWVRATKWAAGTRLPDPIIGRGDDYEWPEVPWPVGRTPPPRYWRDTKDQMVASAFEEMFPTPSVTYHPGLIQTQEESARVVIMGPVSSKMGGYPAALGIPGGPPPPPRPRAGRHGGGRERVRYSNQVQ